MPKKAITADQLSSDECIWPHLHFLLINPLMMTDSEQVKGQVNKNHGPKNVNSIFDFIPDHVSLVLFDLYYAISITLIKLVGWDRKSWEDEPIENTISNFNMHVAEVLVLILD